MKLYLLCLLTLLVSCTSHIKTKSANSSILNEGIVYYLPKRVWDVQTTYQVTSCKEVKNEIIFEGKYEVTIVDTIIQGEPMVMDLSDLKGFTKNFNSNIQLTKDGILKSINVKVEDRTGEFVKNVTQAGFEITKTSFIPLIPEIEAAYKDESLSSKICKVPLADATTKIDALLAQKDKIKADLDKNQEELKSINEILYQYNLLKKELNGVEEKKSYAAMKNSNVMTKEEAKHIKWVHAEYQKVLSKLQKQKSLELYTQKVKALQYKIKVIDSKIQKLKVLHLVKKRRIFDFSENKFEFKMIEAKDFGFEDADQKSFNKTNLVIILNDLKSGKEFSPSFDGAQKFGEVEGLIVKSPKYVTAKLVGPDNKLVSKQIISVPQLGYYMNLEISSKSWSTDSIGYVFDPVTGTPVQIVNSSTAQSEQVGENLKTLSEEIKGFSDHLSEQQRLKDSVKTAVETKVLSDKIAAFESKEREFTFLENEASFYDSQIPKSEEELKKESLIKETETVTAQIKLLEEQKKLETLQREIEETKSE